MYYSITVVAVAIHNTYKLFFTVDGYKKGFVWHNFKIWNNIPVA